MRRVLTTFLEGEAREVAKVVVALGREIVAHGRPVAAPACLILGGETTVTLRGQGTGGRNQELALAAALTAGPVAGKAADRRSLTGHRRHRWANQLGRRHGRRHDPWTAAERSGWTPRSHLADNNSNPYLEAVGDLLVTGPTQTNVNDLVFVFVWPENVGQIANLPHP